MKFITQPRVGTSYNEILALQMAARDRGWDVIPAETTWRLDDDLIATGSFGIPYGSQLFCEVIAQQMGWRIRLNPFDWLAKVPMKYLKRNVDFMTLKEVKNITERKFIKPADDKCFDVGVFNPGEFRYNGELPDETPILVSDVVHFLSEFRCFVSEEGRCETQCCYLLNGDLANPRNYYSIDAEFGYGSAAEFVDELLSEYPVLAGSTIDVGILEGQGWAVIESNPVWASSLYGCDAGQALNAMVGSVEKV